jgi:hypothetical protein
MEDYPSMPLSEPNVTYSVAESRADGKAFQVEIRDWKSELADRSLISISGR